MPSRPEYPVLRQRSQPLPWNVLVSPKPCSVMNSFISSDGANSSLQCWHIFLTSRCARIALTAAEIRYGSTPMLMSRVIELGASLVCSVLSTRWPVSDACTAMRAVHVDGAVVENTHHDLLARRARQGGKSQVDLSAVHDGADASVLRQPPLGDVEVRHDLQTADDRRVHLVGRVHRLEQDAVDA